MTIFNSKLDQNSTSFKTNISDHLALIDQMRLLEKRTIKKSEKRKPVFLERGQLTPRERLFSLLDPGLPFLELFNFAGYLVDDTSPETSCPGANMIMGIGFVNGAAFVLPGFLPLLGRVIVVTSIVLPHSGHSSSVLPKS